MYHRVYSARWGFPRVRLCTDPVISRRGVGSRESHSTQVVITVSHGRGRKANCREWDRSKDGVASAFAFSTPKGNLRMVHQPCSRQRLPQSRQVYWRVGGSSADRVCATRASTSCSSSQAPQCLRRVYSNPPSSCNSLPSAMVRSPRFSCGISSTRLALSDPTWVQPSGQERPPDGIGSRKVPHPQNSSSICGPATSAPAASESLSLSIVAVPSIVISIG